MPKDFNSSITLTDVMPEPEHTDVVHELTDALVGLPQGADYRTFLANTRTGNTSFDAYVEAVALEMQAYDAIDPYNYKRNALRDITDKADSFLKRHAGMNFEGFLRQANPDDFEGSDFGILPPKRNLRRRLFEHRARLYLAALEDYEQGGHKLMYVLPEIERSTIPYLKPERNEPTFQEILKVLGNKS